MDQTRAKNDHSSHCATAELSHGHQKEHVKSEDRRPRGGEQWKKKGSNSDGHHGAKPEREHRTEAIGIIVGANTVTLITLKYCKLIIC